mgnify:CR=1 FL=1
MQFEISRDGALKKLDNFINAELPNYNFKRNFDLGPDDKSNVSCLSPYISHRLITEYEVAKIVLAKFPYQKVEKFKRIRMASGDAIKSGDIVEIELIIESKNDYEYLMFEDMKAAGFEPVDLRSGYTRNGMGAYMELRDQKVTFFVRSLPRGKHSISYKMRAETPGKFSALPSRAEAMYAPELRANSDEIKISITE